MVTSMAPVQETGKVYRTTDYSQGVVVDLVNVCPFKGMIEPRWQCGARGSNASQLVGGHLVVAGGTSSE